jgi:hypothetical protein
VIISYGEKIGIFQLQERYIRVALVAIALILLLAGTLVSLNAHLQPQIVGWLAIGLFYFYYPWERLSPPPNGLVTIIGFWLLEVVPPPWG